MKVILFLFLGVLMSCSTPSLLPDKENVKMGREEPDEKCRNLGKIEGKVFTIRGTPQQALDDLQQVASNKGADYVQIKQYSENKTTVTGIAYSCP